MNRYPLHYICKFCGVTVAEFPDIASPERHTLSVCDSPECRREAARAYRATPEQRILRDIDRLTALTTRARDCGRHIEL